MWKRRLILGAVLFIAMLAVPMALVNAGGADALEQPTARQSRGFSNVSITGNALSWDPISGADSYDVVLQSGGAAQTITVWDNHASLPIGEMCAGASGRVWHLTLRAYAGTRMLLEEGGYAITCG